MEEKEQGVSQGPTGATKPGTFPDQIRVNRVREALWGGANGASVMVGSGFSRNAQVKLAGLSRLPDWEALVRAMQRKLDPSATDEGATDASRSIDPLAVAQQYCDEFGRAELHRFIRDQIRNDEIEPSDYHRRLLALPWSDVLTTNWGHVAGANSQNGSPRRATAS